MDWETYNVEQDESQPTDIDLSFGYPTPSDAEREADGKAHLKEGRRRKKGRGTTDSKESSEFSGSPTVCSCDSFQTLQSLFVLILLFYTFIQDSLSDKKAENETPESSSESVEVIYHVECTLSRVTTI